VSGPFAASPINVSNESKSAAEGSTCQVVPIYGHLADVCQMPLVAQINI